MAGLGTELILIRSAEGSGNLTGLTNEPTLNGGATLVADVGAGGTDAISLDGVDGYLRVNGMQSILTGFPYAYSLWVKPSSMANFETIASLCQHSEFSSRYLAVDRRTGAWNLRARNTTDRNATSSIPVINDVWTHIAVTFDSDTSKKMFVNGVFASEITDSVTHATQFNSFLVGRLRNQQSFQYGGLADNIAFYLHSLTEEDVTELYNQGFGRTHDKSPAPGTLQTSRLENLL